MRIDHSGYDGAPTSIDHLRPRSCEHSCFTIRPHENNAAVANRKGGRTRMRIVHRVNRAVDDDEVCLRRNGLRLERDGRSAADQKGAKRCLNLHA